MKKLIIFFILVGIIIAVVSFNYLCYNINRENILQENSYFEQYKDIEINGLDVATLINKAVDNNTKNKVEKDENGNFISNDENSLQLEIYMLDNEKTYKMETIYDGGTEQFVQYYGNIKFKCSKIEYHQKTGRVKYLFFEQIETS